MNDNHLVLSINETLSQEGVADGGALLAFSSIPSQQFVKNIDERMKTSTEPRQMKKKRKRWGMVIFDSTCENGS